MARMCCILSIYPIQRSHSECIFKRWPNKEIKISKIYKCRGTLVDARIHTEQLYYVGRKKCSTFDTDIPLKYKLSLSREPAKGGKRGSERCEWIAIKTLLTLFVFGQRQFMPIRTWNWKLFSELNTHSHVALFFFVSISFLFQFLDLFCEFGAVVMLRFGSVVSYR